MMKIVQFCCICFLFLLTACQSSNEKQAAATVEVAKAEVPQPEKATAVNIPKVPIYNYAELAPIFEHQNDTTYVINFWATWCKPCVEELPYFVELHEKYQDKAFQLILVSLDFPKQIEKKLMPFLAEHQLPGEVMVLDDPDANTWINAVDPKWSGAIPATIVYHNQKREFHEESFSKFNDLDAIVQRIMR